MRQTASSNTCFKAVNSTTCCHLPFRKKNALSAEAEAEAITLQTRAMHSHGLPTAGEKAARCGSYFLRNPEGGGLVQSEESAAFASDFQCVIPTVTGFQHAAQHGNMIPAAQLQKRDCQTAREGLLGASVKFGKSVPKKQATRRVNHC